MRIGQSDLPTRSEDGMAALDIFYAEFNDINFYVEDEDQENLYKVIFGKLFKRIRIERIFSLGGKRALLKHAASEANQSIKCFRAYVVDRDFDHLLGNQFEHPNVFYLDRFCIESHLLEPTAIVELVIENHPRSRRVDVNAKLSTGSQIRSIYRGLRPLFVLFLCAQALNLGVRNCSSPPESFCETKQRWVLKRRVAISYREGLRVAAKANGLTTDQFDSRCEPLSLRASTVPDFELVSGKYVAAMLFHYIKSKYSLGSMTFDSFVYRLAKNCKLRSMQAFAVRVRSGAQTHRVGSSDMTE